MKAHDILLGFLDLYVLTMWSNPYGRCRKDYYDYLRWRHATAVEKAQTSSSLQYLKRQELIRVYVSRTGKFIELTNKGKRELADSFIRNELTLAQPKRWDGTWRLVIFDIPEQHKVGREVFRETLKHLGFYKLQKSVFIYPYECYKEIAFIRDFYGLRKDIKYLEVKRIEAGVDLVKLFFDRGIISGIR